MSEHPHKHQGWFDNDTVVIDDIEGPPLTEAERAKLMKWFENFTTNMPKGAIVHFGRSIHSPKREFNEYGHRLKGRS